MILQQLAVKHPAAHLLVNLAVMQDWEMGGGTGLVVLSVTMRGILGHAVLHTNAKKH